MDTGNFDSVTTAIAGVGAVTGYGWGFRTLQDGLGSGRPSIARQCVDGMEAIVATVPPHDPALSDADRVSAAVHHAVAEAVDDATQRGWVAGPEVGIIHCTGIGDIRTFRDLYFRSASPKPSDFARMLHTAMPSFVAQHYGWTGPNFVLNAACASGNIALSLANDWLQSKRVSDVIVTGAEFCIIAEIIEGFRRMRVLVGANGQVTDCRPFQEGSRGFFLGEAAVAFVMSTRVAAPRAHMLGGAASHDAYHDVAIDPSGAQIERCIREALDVSGTDATDIVLLKAHGSGTPLNDRIEGTVADRIFGRDTRLCSYKHLIGHCMGASALAELAGLLASWESGCFPGTVDGHEAHPRLLAGEPTAAGPTLCMSVGLGGANAAAVLTPAHNSTK